MVDYNEVDGKVTDFVFKLGDWGTAGNNRKFLGGTPGFVSKTLYEGWKRDDFSIGRLALQLFVDEKGTVN